MNSKTRKLLRSIIANPTVPADDRLKARAVRLMAQDEKRLLGAAIVKPLPMPKLTKKEAEWLLTNRTNPVCQVIIVARNRMMDNPNDPEARNEYARVVLDWRAEREED